MSLWFMVLITSYNYIVTGANLNQLTSLGGLTLNDSNLWGIKEENQERTSLVTILLIIVV